MPFELVKPEFGGHMCQVTPFVLQADTVCFFALELAYCGTFARVALHGFWPMDQLDCFVQGLDSREVTSRGAMRSF